MRALEYKNTHESHRPEAVASLATKAKDREDRTVRVHNSRGGEPVLG